jgi:hypothetical protein
MATAGDRILSGGNLGPRDGSLWLLDASQPRAPTKIGVLAVGDGCCNSIALGSGLLTVTTTQYQPRRHRTWLFDLDPRGSRLFGTHEFEDYLPGPAAVGAGQAYRWPYTGPHDLWVVSPVGRVGEGVTGRRIALPEGLGRGSLGVEGRTLVLLANRGVVQLMDLASPGRPAFAGRLDLAEHMVGDFVQDAPALHDGKLYVVGSGLPSDPMAVWVIDVRDPYRPRIVDRIPLPRHASRVEDAWIWHTLQVVDGRLVLPYSGRYEIGQGMLVGERLAGEG